MKASKEAKAEAIALLALDIPEDSRPMVDGIPFDEFDRDELLVIAKHLAAKKQDRMIAKIQEHMAKAAPHD